MALTQRFIIDLLYLGHSWDRRHHGSYIGSWTWFEASIIRGSSSQPSQGSTDVDELKPTSGSSSLSIDRREIQRNFHASTVDQIHVNTWDYTSNLPKLRKWLTNINRGDSVAVYPRARFSGWENHVKFVRIDLYYACW